MAEATVMRNNALPYPIYGQQFTIVYPWRDADGDLSTAVSTPDAERSLNGDTFADCTNESTEIATGSGVYYLTLTAAEMTADIVAVIAKSATAGAKTPVATLYPRKLVQIRTGTAASGGVSTSTVVLDASASAVDDFYNGMVVAVVIDGAASAECRVITDYTGSTQTCTVVPDFNTAPDNNDTFIVYLPEGPQLHQSNTTAWNGAQVATVTTAGVPEVDVTHWLGTAAATPTVAGVPEVDITHIAGSAVSTTSAQLGVNIVNAAGTAWASGSLTSGVFASGAITATAIAADAIGASELAADAVAEIADAVWDEDATGHQTGGTFGQAIGDPGADTNTIFKAVVTDATGATVGVDGAAILADTNELQTDWVNGGRLDLILDARASQTSVDTIDDFLDTEVAAILADTNELQTDWVDGGRLDLLIDAIKAKTDLVPGTQDGKTFAELVLLMAAAILGKASGLATTTAVYRSVDDTLDRITATVDADGNRSAVTYDTTSP